MTDFSLPESGLVIESFSDPESLTVPKNELEICVYRGIPYADAERFRESVVREKIPSELPIIKATPHFPQPNEFNLSNWLTLPRTLKKEDVSYASEKDPLYLNIFTKNNKKTKKPVIVYVHGGTLLIGGASSYDGHAIAAIGDVIFVSINYRLGSFGTLFGGNWALSDVLSALKWVKLHIGKFGGDRENVTLMGYSAGGMMVDLLMSSPRSRGLFHRAMSFSGNGSSPWIWTRKEKQAHNMARLKKILNEDNEEKVRKILTEMPFDELMQKIEYPAWTEPDYFYWTFSAGNSILPKIPYGDLEESFTMDVPYLIGRTNDEGCYSMSFYHHPKFLEGLSKDDFKEVVIRTAKGRRMILNELDEERYPEIIEEYFGKEFDKDDQFYYTKIFGKWFGEMEIGIAIESRARSMKNAFVYRNCYKPLFARDESYRGELTSARPDWTKADHGDCYSFIFGIPLYKINAQNVKYSDEEKNLSLRWIENLTHFARTGKPKDENWKPFSEKETRMEIQSDAGSELLMKNNL